MKEHLSSCHCGNTVQLGMSAVAANHQRTQNPINFEQRQFVAAATIAFLITSSHIDLCILMNDFSGRVDDMHDVQKVITALSYRSHNRPDIALCRRLTRKIQCFFDRPGSKFNSVWEVIAGKIRLREQHHTGSRFSSDLNVMFSFSDVVINRLCPVHLDTRDSKSFRRIVHYTIPFYSEVNPARHTNNDQLSLQE